jgi:hypothetical protein
MSQNKQATTLAPSSNSNTTSSATGQRQPLYAMKQSQLDTAAIELLDRGCSGRGKLNGSNRDPPSFSVTRQARPFCLRLLSISGLSQPLPAPIYTSLSPIADPAIQHSPAQYEHTKEHCSSGCVYIDSHDHDVASGVMRLLQRESLAGSGEEVPVQ